MLRLLALTIAALLILAAPVEAHDSGFGVARYLPDGSLDPSFGSNGLVVARSTNRNLVANALALQPDGKILVGGMSTDLATGSLQLALARYTADGAPDLTFATDGAISSPAGAGGAQASAIALQSDGKILVAGTAFAQGAGDDQFILARYTSAGQPDAAFGSAGGQVMTHIGAGASSIQAIALQPDGRIVVAGTAYANGATDDDFAVARYTSDGALDETFGTGGIVTTDFGEVQAPSDTPSLDRAGAILVQGDGSILVAGVQRGSAQSVLLARYTSSGHIDPSFGVGGKTRTPAADPQVFGLMVQPDGHLLVAGTTRTKASSATAPFAIFSFQSDGTPDPGFGTDGVLADSVEGSRSGARALVVQPDGKLVTAGAKYGAPSAQGDAQPQSGFALARYDPWGHVDASFGASGRVLTDMGDAGALPLALIVQPDGKILAAGLVFFQVATPAAAELVSPFRVATRIAAPTAGLALLATALALIVATRRRQ